VDTIRGESATHDCLCPTPTNCSAVVRTNGPLSPPVTRISSCAHHGPWIMHHPTVRSHTRAALFPSRLLHCQVGGAEGLSSASDARHLTLLPLGGFTLESHEAGFNHQFTHVHPKRTSADSSARLKLVRGVSGVIYTDFLI
jgi:hypothetical protein